MHGRSQPCDYRPELLVTTHTTKSIMGGRGFFGSQIERVESVKTGKLRQRGGVVVCRLNLQSRSREMKADDIRALCIQSGTPAHEQCCPH